MQLEEVVHFSELFPTVSEEEIRMHLGIYQYETKAVRLFKIVNYFSEKVLNRDQYIHSDQYKLSLKNDLKQLEWFFPKVNKSKLQFILETLGPIPNRRLIVVKLLMEYPQSERIKMGLKRYLEIDAEDNPEVSSTKINKTDIDESNAENFHHDIPEMVIRNNAIASESKESILDSSIGDWGETRVEDMIVPDVADNNRQVNPPQEFEYNPRESAVNSTTTEANITPQKPCQKRTDTIVINDSQASNIAPIKDMHEFVEILDSPLRNKPEAVPGTSDFRLPFRIDGESSNHQPGPSYKSICSTSPPQGESEAAPLQPGFMWGSEIGSLDPYASVPGPSNTPRPGNSLDYRPGPSNISRITLPNPLHRPENFMRATMPHIVSLRNQPINLSPNSWRPMQPADSSDEDDEYDDEDALVSTTGDVMDCAENLVMKPEPSVPPLEPIDEDLPVNLAVDEKLVLKLMEVFPNVSPHYLRNICAGKQWSEAIFEQLMDTILASDNIPARPERPVSPEKELDPQEQLAMLKSLFPDADPTYLQRKVDELNGDQAGMTAFIEKAMDRKDYPTMKEYLRQQQLSAQHKQYTSEFKVEKFVEIFPDPVAFFENPERKSNIESYDKYYIKWLLRNKYTQLYVKDINHALEFANVFLMVNYLEKRLKDGAVKSVKGGCAMASPDSHRIAIPLLQELAYFEHKEEILKYLEEKKAQAAQDRLEAKQMGLMQTCNCCFDDEVMPLDILTCTGGCRFCRECIKRSSEVAFGDGKINFPCLSDGCDREFGLQMLQNVLDPKLFSKIAQKQAVAEVKAAGLEDLESCPFCDFANIPAPEDKVFRCLNPDCMKESCRLCKEPSHLPLRCDEVEKDEAVKARTFIENKMAEALIRECWKCGAKFIKEEGCNKMTCSCGAMMCYVCRQPVKNYKHFNGQGGDQFNLCPLYSDNILNNEKKVLEAAVEAKKQVDPAKLKNDPTVTVQQLADKIKRAEQKSEHTQQQMARVHLIDDLRHRNHPRVVLHHYDRVIAAVAAQGAGPFRDRPRELVEYAAARQRLDEFRRRRR